MKTKHCYIIKKNITFWVLNSKVKSIVLKSKTFKIEQKMKAL